MLFAIVLIFTMILVFHYCIKWFTPKDITGQTVLITGAASGIGRQTALNFAKDSCKVIIWDVNEAGMQKVAKEVEALGGSSACYKVDITDRETVYAVAKKVQEEHGFVDILVNNAGVVSGKSLLDIPDKAIELTLKVNTIAQFWTVKAFLPAMYERNSGHICTVASAAGTTGIANMTDYCASKFAAFGFAEALRMEIKKKKMNGINTTCVCPYYINTGMFEGAKSKLPFILPILTEDYVGKRIVDAIRCDEACIYLPFTVKLTFLARALFPAEWCDLIAGAFGVNDSMDDFKGRSVINKVKGE